MASTPVSIRLDDGTLTRLRAASKVAQRPIATHAADLIRSGLSGASPPRVADGEHPLVAHVLAMFARLEGLDVDSQREAALVLAKIAAAGGAPAVGAVKELRSIFFEVERLTDHDDFGDQLSEPTGGIA